MTPIVDATGLTEILRSFAADRDWEQFHTPKNLAMALAGEAGELLALLQWLSDREIADRLQDAGFRTSFEDEIADVLIYLVRLADIADVKLDESVANKMARNAIRYPIEPPEGTST